MSGLRILADDLTGALDTAAAFDGEVPVLFDAPGPALDGAPVGVVATATRDVAPDVLPALLAPALDWLAGAGIAFKKVDSLLRGNTFAEVRLAAAAGGFEEVIFAPAFPQQRRLAVGGRLVVDGTATGPAFGDVLSGLPLVAPGVRDDGDLLRLAGAVRDGRRRLWCGSAGLAQALAQALDAAVRPGARIDEAAARPLLLVSASHHAVSRRQWSHLPAGGPGTLAVRHGEGLDAALAAMRSPFDAALLDLAPAAPLPPADAQALLARQLGAIAAAAPRPGVLVVVGGDTLRGLCRTTGANGLSALAAARPGWGRARWLGGRWDGVPCHTRSGAFGDDEDLAAMLRRLAPRAH